MMIRPSSQPPQLLTGLLNSTTRASNVRKGVAIAVLAAILIALCVVSLGIGRLSIPVPTILHILYGAAFSSTDAGVANTLWTDSEWAVVTLIRLPRIIVALVAGMGLGLCGAVLQGLFRNPLVGPEIVGVTNGAAFGGVCSILFGFGAVAIVFNAVMGGMAAIAICFALARVTGRSTITLVLTGLIVSAFFSACVGVVQYVADPDVKLPSIVYWLMGSFASADWPKVTTITAPFLFSSMLLFLMSWRLNVMSLDELDAATLGGNIALLRWFMIFLVALMLAAQVAVSGGIGWVGLIIPHFARMLFGADHHYLIPASALIGGIYMVAIDDIARTASNQDIPIGLLTALIGTPIFAWLLWKNKKQGWKPD